MEGITIYLGGEPEKYPAYIHPIPSHPIPFRPVPSTRKSKSTLQRMCDFHVKRPLRSHSMSHTVRRRLATPNCRRVSQRNLVLKAFTCTRSHRAFDGESQFAPHNFLGGYLPQNKPTDRQITHAYQSNSDPRIATHGGLSGQVRAWVGLGFALW